MKPEFMVILLGKCNEARLHKNKLECVDSEEALDFFDAVYRAKKGSLKIKDNEGKELSWFEVIFNRAKEEPNTWILFSVYYDLRERGRNVREGPFPNTLELISNEKPYAFVFVVEETVKFEIVNLVQWLDLSRRFGREVIVAIVDKHGDVSYYSMERFS